MAKTGDDGIIWLLILFSFPRLGTKQDNIGIFIYNIFFVYL